MNDLLWKQNVIWSVTRVKVCPVWQCCDVVEGTNPLTGSQVGGLWSRRVFPTFGPNFVVSKLSVCWRRKQRSLSPGLQTGLVCGSFHACLGSIPCWKMNPLWHILLRQKGKEQPNEVGFLCRAAVELILCLKVTWKQPHISIFPPSIFTGGVLHLCIYIIAECGLEYMQTRSNGLFEWCNLHVTHLPSIPPLLV